MKIPKENATDIKPLAYRKSIVTFIDILGFKSTVDRIPAYAIYDILKTFKKHAGATDEEVVREFDLVKKINWTRCVFFSDSVVRIRPLDSEHRDGSLFYEILDLLHAQWSLANQGVFIRGGLTIGEVHQDSDMLFGPALIQAYNLETSCAKYPRIVIDPAVFRAFRNDHDLRAGHHNLSQDIAFINKLIRQGDDGLYAIDYLGAIRGEMDFPEAFPDYLAEVKKQIVSQAGAAAGKHSILQKYLWMAKYLNEVSSKYTDCATNDRVTITADDIPEMSAF